MLKLEVQEVRDEFRLIQFRLLYPNSGDFAESPWLSLPVILAYRLIIAAYCTGWLIYSGFHPANGQEKWFIYLTNWSFLFVTVYFIISTVITAFYYKDECRQGEYDIGSPEPIPLRRSRSGMSRSSDTDSRDRAREETRGSREGAETRDAARDNTRAHPNARSIEEVKASVNPLEVMQEIPMSFYHEALWLIFNIAANSALLITATNWDYAGFKTDGLVVTTQILNTVFVLTEILLGTVPIRLYHVIYPMLFTTFYVMFTVVYWACQGTNTAGQPFIYSVLDYSGNAKQSVGALLGFVFIGHPLAQLVLFIVFRIRVWLSRKFSKKLIW